MQRISLRSIRQQQPNGQMVSLWSSGCFQPRYASLTQQFRNGQRRVWQVDDILRSGPGQQIVGQAPVVLPPFLPALQLRQYGGCEHTVMTAGNRAAYIACGYLKPDGGVANGHSQLSGCSQRALPSGFTSCRIAACVGFQPISV